MRMRTTKTSEQPDVNLAFRFPRALVDRLDARRDMLARGMPGITRADVVRMALIEALDRYDMEQPKRR